MAKQAKPPLSEKEQHRLFVTAARELGCDESEVAFDAALAQIARAKPTSLKPSKSKSLTKRKI
jgi:hypothetical protein